MRTREQILEEIGMVQYKLNLASSAIAITDVSKKNSWQLQQQELEMKLDKLSVEMAEAIEEESKSEWNEPSKNFDNPASNFENESEPFDVEAADALLNLLIAEEESTAGTTEPISIAQAEDQLNQLIAVCSAKEEAMCEIAQKRADAEQMLADAAQKLVNAREEADKILREAEQIRQEAFLNRSLSNTQTTLTADIVDENAQKNAKIALRKAELMALRVEIAEVCNSQNAFILREKFASIQSSFDKEERASLELLYLMQKSLDDIAHKEEVTALKKRIAQLKRLTVDSAIVRKMPIRPENLRR